MQLKRIGFMALTLTLASLPVFAQGAGVFDKTTDWDLGDGTKVAGSATENGGVYTLMGNGNDIWGNADEGFFLYTEKPAGESWQLSGLVEWVDHGTNDWAKFGPMVRNDAADTASSHMFTVLQGANTLVAPEFRDAAGLGTNDGRGRLPSAPATDLTGPVYLRTGYWAPLNVVYSEVSTDGTTWYDVASTQLTDMGSSYSIGFAITNHEGNDQLATGKVSNVKLEQVTTAPAFLNQGGVGDFTSQLDIGGYNQPGSASFDNGTYTVSGSGGDIWGGSDRMHFLYKEMTGSFEATGDIFITGVAEPTWTKGGLMVRSNLSSGSSNGFAMLRSDAQHHMQQRSSQSTDSADASDLLAYDLTNGKFKIRKVGNLVENYYQDTAGAWVKHGEAILTDIGENYYFGIAITAHDDTLMGTVEVSDLQVTEYPFEVVRSQAVTNYTPGQTFNVDVQVNPRDGQTISSLVIKEAVPPEAVDISGISGGGVLADGVITWTLSSVSAPQTLSYSVTTSTDVNVASLNWGASTSTGDGLELPVAGAKRLEAVTFNVAETFSYPSNDSNELEGDTIVGLDGGFNWGSDNAWAKSGDLTNAVLNVDTLDAGLVQSQPTEYNPGNYSAELSGDNTDGISRNLPVNAIGGEVWVSFTYKETGPAADHWSGMTLYNADGNEVSFIGKPYGAETLGIGNLPGDDVLTDVPYNENHHILARINVNGANSSVSLWVDPDKEDRINTPDAEGADSVDSVASIRLRRGGASGSAYFDNLWVSSVPALPPAGAGRVNLEIDDPNRPANLPAWDVISIDQIDDAVTGIPGFGHDNGNDHYLIVTGNIYFTDVANLSGQVVAFGLPVDHMSGLNGHILGPYNNYIDDLGLKNSIKFMNNADQTGPFTFDLVPPGKYSELRSAQTVGNGDGELTATFTYDDGTTSTGAFHADDWYNDGGEIQFANTRQLVDGMNRLQGGASEFDARFDPAVFECIQPVDPAKTLVSVTLEYNADVDPDFGYNLFDIWAVPADSGTPVSDWSLF
ncbi:MAG: hypothetical protein GC154_14290 [bacterium]|nr:hypothetical protein [bacterium]